MVIVISKQRAAI